MQHLLPKLTDFYDNCLCPAIVSPTYLMGLKMHDLIECLYNIIVCHNEMFVLQEYRWSIIGLVHDWYSVYMISRFRLPQRNCRPQDLRSLEQSSFYSP